MNSERAILESLDRESVPRASSFLSALTTEVDALLKRDPSARLAWRTVPLEIYDNLPHGIASSWVFVLRRLFLGRRAPSQQHPARHVLPRLGRHANLGRQPPGFQRAPK